MLHAEVHVKFISKLFQQSKDPLGRSLEFILSDSIHLNALHWTITSALLLKRSDLLDLNEIRHFLSSCYDSSSGAFSSSPGHDIHILPTLFAVQIYRILKLEYPNPTLTLKYVQSLQLSDGSFMGDKWGEIDTRFSYAAISICYLLREHDQVHGTSFTENVCQFSSFIDTKKALEFIDSCRNFDGGYGSRPGSESHAGQIFCCIGAITIAGQIDSISNGDRLAWWLAERQLPKNGGLNGRPEKLEDVCYSWWVIASLEMLKRRDWIDGDKLIKFILSAQDSDNGGFSDRPGDCTDIFHTCFGLAALSLFEYEGIPPIDVRFCMVL